jgi:hypothetical protein
VSAVERGAAVDSFVAELIVNVTEYRNQIMARVAVPRSLPPPTPRY